MSEPRKTRVIVELRARPELVEMAVAAAAGAEIGLPEAVRPQLGPLEWDAVYSPVEVPAEVEAAGFAGFGPESALAEHTGATYVVRGEVEEAELAVLKALAKEQEEVVGIYADEVIEPFPTCGGSAPMGSDKDVERLLDVPALGAAGMDGRGVLVVIVDGGINLAHLAKKGKPAALDAQRSWSVNPALTPGKAPVGHGTMCAYDALIAAPSCTLADVALFGASQFAKLLTDAIRAYGHLRDQIVSGGLFGDYRGLVVNNSWGMFHPTWDFPVGDPGNYSDNPRHLFNRIVVSLERYGADIVFAAGNCGYQCPDPRCRGVSKRTIYGANSHSAVLTVGGVDTNKDRVGYSSTGPGRLIDRKPDVVCYTHFAGSGVYAADGGTSAAAPVAAGVLAAVRSALPYDPARPATHPSSLRGHVIHHLDRLGMAKHSYELGWGLVDGSALAKAPLPA